MGLVIASLGADTGTTNGTTPVDVVGAPGALVYRIGHRVGVKNIDSASITGSLQLYDGTNTTVLEDFTLAVGATWRTTDVFFLDATTKKLQIVLAGAMTTANSRWWSQWEDMQ